MGGLAGDMFNAALLHARPDLLSMVQEAVACLAMPVPVRIELLDNGATIAGKRFQVQKVGAVPEQGHHHTSFQDIRRMLQTASLAAGVCERAIAIFTLLAEAEGRVHGESPEAVSFHEVGSWDSIADIVGAATLLEALSVRSASTVPLPLGGGRVRTAHGILPVPAPATALLLEGLPVMDDGIPGERVTPTGAAILKSLRPSRKRPADGTLLHCGYGFGSRELEGIPNCLQVLCIQGTARPGFKPEQDRVTALGFEIDDQTGEDFALAMDRLRAMHGVLSVTSLHAIGKGGRPTMRVEVLVRPEELSRVAEACFRETTTIGLRVQDLDRLLLSRRQRGIEVGGRTLEAKLVQRPDGPTAKVESRDLKATPDHREREHLRQTGAAVALGGDADLD